MARADDRRGSHLTAVPDSGAALEEYLSAAGRSRGHRRSDVVGYELRIELSDVQPTVWRCVAVPSTMMLDELHDVVQDAMGWTDSHLHEWRTRPDVFAPGAESYGMRSVVDEGDRPFAACETDVRIDEVLAERGDTLYYEYDFGDGWDHRVVLAHVVDPVDAPVCLDGARACPPEDCGGSVGYEHLCAILADPAHPEYTHLREWAGEDFAPEHFDLAAASATLAARTEIRRHLPSRGTALAQLLERIPAPYAPTLYSLLLRAGLRGDPVELELPEPGAEGLTLLLWLLRRLGTAGVKLTPAGYLPPAVVAEAREVLGPQYRWRGTSSRENDNPPVMALRKSMQQLGLARRYKGALVRTKRGEALVSDPQALVEYIADRLPLGSDVIDHEAGLLLLLCIAGGAGRDEETRALLEAMTALGWRMNDGAPLTELDATRAADANRRFFLNVGWNRGFRDTPGQLPVVVRELARRALRGGSG